MPTATRVMFACAGRVGPLWGAFARFHEGRLLKDDNGRRGVVMSARYRNYDHCNQLRPITYLVRTAVLLRMAMRTRTCRHDACIVCYLVCVLQTCLQQKTAA
eukprot:359853-Chlamydomonas_euryale.AAC.14